MAGNSVEVKICGIRDEAHLKIALDAGADYIGFIFVKHSPRYITPQAAAEMVSDLSQEIRPAGRKVVAVLADPDDQELADVLTVLSPDIVQLHGNEPRERIRDIAGLYDIRLMKALAVASADDIEAAQSYVGYADMLLFDTKTADGSSGGTGQTFDWQLLQNAKITLPWFLSGGLNAENVAEAIRITGAKRVDVSSGVESSRAQKDEKLIKQFLQQTKTLSPSSETDDNNA
jgi:phosphoribosylanthranilate isomerase